MIKYEYEVTELQRGTHSIKSGALILFIVIVFYVLFLFFDKGVSGRDQFIVFLIACLIGIKFILEGLYCIKLNKGKWLFRLDNVGLYLLAPNGVEKLIGLNRISSLDVVEDNNDYESYCVITKDSVAMSIGLPIHVDYFSVVKCFEQLGVKVHRLNFKKYADYTQELLNRKIEHQVFLYSDFYKLDNDTF